MQRFTVQQNYWTQVKYIILISKVKVLKCTDSIKIENTVIGQYVKNEQGSESQKKGYLDDETVKEGS